MTEEQFDKIKTGYLENIKKYLVEAGGLFPHISVFADHKNEDITDSAIIHIPIPDKFMNSDLAKTKFVEEMLPEIAEKINERFKILGVAWASEAWMRHMPKDVVDNGIIPKNWKDLPKKEVLIVTMETAHKDEVSIYEMHREGLKVNDEGEMIDQITLEELPNVSTGSGAHTSEGRFTGLYKKFLKHSAE